MKNFFVSISVLGFLFSHSSFSAGPNIEPGPVMELDQKSLDLVTVLTHKDVAPSFADFSDAGNTVTSASVQYLSPMVSVYKLANKHCTKGGFAGGLCLGGSQLTIKATTRLGNMPVTTYTTQLVYFR